MLKAPSCFTDDWDAAFPALLSYLFSYTLGWFLKGSSGSNYQHCAQNFAFVPVVSTQPLDRWYRQTANAQKMSPQLLLCARIPPSKYEIQLTLRFPLTEDSATNKITVRKYPASDTAQQVFTTGV
jgi:hypothetical protein